ncbi:MAG TPA: hypothetical protein VKM93_12015 [Terriglobia bacterium]|nr:hypothetical protein [Terriglobia bacterium]
MKEENVPLDALRMEEGAEELLKSPAVQPYIRLAQAVAAGGDPEAAAKELSELPLEQRYLWRVASALELAFADFDSSSIRADLETLSPEALEKVASLVHPRPLQFCLFLAALFGVEAMEKVMTQAIRLGKECSQPDEASEEEPWES